MRLAMKKKQHREQQLQQRIPDDLLFNEILIRLPVQSLQRFLWVCKSWYSTISSPSFIAAHRQHNHRFCKGTTSILKLFHGHLDIHHYDNDNDNGDVNEASISTPTYEVFLNDRLCLLCLACWDGLWFRTCHAYSEGILCFLIPEVPEYYIDTDTGVPEITTARFYYREKITLFNPMLCKSLTLPTSYDHFSYVNDHKIASQLNDTYLIFGFGYDKLSCDYKVVRATLIDARKHKFRKSIKGITKSSGVVLRANVYSLNAKTWRSFDICHLPCRIAEVRGHSSTFSGVNVNGVLYWTFGDCLLAFSLVDEVFHYHVCLPEEVAEAGFASVQPIAVKLLDGNGDENNMIKLGLLWGLHSRSCDLWVLMDQSPSQTEGAGAWIKLLNVDGKIELANYLDFHYLVDIQLTVAKNNNGQWILSPLKNESEMFASLENQCYDNRIHLKGLLLLVSFQESLVGIV